MADNKKNNEVPVITDAAPAASETPQEEGLNISIEQICAAIINTYKTIVVPLDNLVKDYSNKNIAVNQDEETRVLTFTLTDIVPQEENSPEESPAESE